MLVSRVCDLPTNRGNGFRICSRNNLRGRCLQPVESARKRRSTWEAVMEETFDINGDGYIDAMSVDSNGDRTGP